MLGITPIEIEKTVIDSANALIDLGIVKAKGKKQKKAETDAAKTEDEKSKELEPEEKEKINESKNTTEVSAN